MNRQFVLYQSLAACGAAIIAFIGVVHEVAGPLIFPFAPPLFGDLLWHGVGIFAIALGLLLLGGTLGVINFPVKVAAAVAIIGGIAAMAYMAIWHDRFHFFALCLMCAGTANMVFHGKAKAMLKSG